LYKSGSSLEVLQPKLVSKLAWPLLTGGLCSEVACNTGLTVQSDLSTTATLAIPKKRPLFRGGRYSEVSPIKLQLVLDVWVSGWPLLTGGRCSEVAFNTGLTYCYHLVIVINLSQS
jgi:hypothetical protein